MARAPGGARIRVVSGYDRRRPDTRARAGPRSPDSADSTAGGALGELMRIKDFRTGGERIRLSLIARRGRASQPWQNARHANAVTSSAARRVPPATRRRCLAAAQQTAGRRVAVRLLRAGVRDGRRRRRDAAHAFRAVDHRMAADRRHAAAADRRAVAGDVRQVPADARVPAGQQGRWRSPSSRASSGGSTSIGCSAGRSAWSSCCRSLWFAVRRRIPRGHAWKLAGIFVLGGLQGAMGWYMVQSGLVDDPRVSQFRLTAHLALALVDLRGDAVGRAVARRIRGGRRWSSPAQRAARRYARARRRARLPHGADRRLRRRHPRRFRLQHVSADERRGRSARDLHDRAVVEELLLEHGDGAVRPSR